MANLKKQPLEEKFGRTIRLDRKAIALILSKIKEHGLTSVIKKNRNDQTTYSSIDEFIEHNGNKTSEIFIEGYKDSNDRYELAEIKISVNKEKTELNSTDEYATPHNDIRKIIESTKSWTNIFTARCLFDWLSYPIISGSATLLLITAENRYGLHIAIIYAFIYTLVITILSVIISLNFSNSKSIQLASKKEITEKKKQLRQNICLMLLGIVGGGIFTILIKKILHI